MAAHPRPLARGKKGRGRGEEHDDRRGRIRVAPPPPRTRSGSFVGVVELGRMHWNISRHMADAGRRCFRHPSLPLLPTQNLKYHKFEEKNTKKLQQIQGRNLLCEVLQSSQRMRSLEVRQAQRRTGKEGAAGPASRSSSTGTRAASRHRRGRGVSAMAVGAVAAPPVAAAVAAGSSAVQRRLRRGVRSPTCRTPWRPAVV